MSSIRVFNPFSSSFEFGPGLFATLALASLLFRAWFAWVLPITGDEAYFYYWGVNPDWGFYDHPPMVGWWLAALAKFSHHPFVLRLPSLLLPLALAGVAFVLLRRYRTSLAWAAASLVLLLPLNAWNVAITTDIPLIFFAALTLWFYVRARRSDRALDYIVCGLALGAALMSKYFAGLLALALAAHCLFAVRTAPNRRRPWLGLALIILFSLPAAAVQLNWNSQNCWPNLMFNLVNRHGNSGWSWRTPLLYLVTIAYVMTPPVVLWLVKRDHMVRSQQASVGAMVFDRSIFAWVSLAGFLAFLLLSTVKTIGLHWVAIFVLPGALWFVIRASERQLRASLRFAAGFALLHYLLIAAVMLAPVETFSRWRGYAGLVMTLAQDDLTRALEPYRQDRSGRRLDEQQLQLASDGYSAAVTMGFNLHQYMLVFGPGSSHARHDDILSDLSKLQGKNFLIVRREASGNLDDARYFERIQTHEIQVRGARFYLTQGYTFRYEAYRDEVLEQVRQRYYQVPSWLPRGPCYFCDRYFAQKACHR